MKRKRDEPVSVLQPFAGPLSNGEARRAATVRRPRWEGRRWSWSYLLLILCPALCADAFWIAFYPFAGLVLLVCFSLLSAAAAARADARPEIDAGGTNDSFAGWRKSGGAVSSPNDDDLDLPGDRHRRENHANIADLIAIMERVASIFWAALLTGPLIAIWCVIAAVVFDPDFEIDLMAGAALALAARMLLILLSFSAILAQVLTLAANR